MKVLTTTLRIAAVAAFIALASISAAMAQFPKTVLIEEFTSVTCGPCRTATAKLNSIVDDNNGLVATIRYHLNLPIPGDPWYKKNTADNTARRNFYNVNALPAAHINGIFVDPNNEGAMRSIVDNGKAEDAPIKLDVTQTGEGGMFNVKVTATAGPDGLPSGYRLRVAIVEGFIHDESVTSIPNSNGETEFYDVFRKYLTSAAGEDVVIASNGTKVFDYQYTAESDWQVGQLYIIAFVQDDFDQETFAQVGISAKPSVSGITEPTLMVGYTLAPSVPNPAQSTAMVEYALGAPEEVSIELYDAAGKLVQIYQEGLQGEGKHATQIDVSALTSGQYIYTLRAGAYVASQRLTVVK